MNNSKIKKIKKNKIIIDARLYGPFAKGLGRYTQEIVDNIIKIDRDNDYLIFLGKNNYDEFVLDKEFSNIKKKLVNIKLYSLKEQILLPFYIYREKADLVHFPHFNVPVFCSSKFIVTIHDLILTKFKTLRATTLSPFIYNIKNFFYKLVIKTALKKSEKIITVSNFTKKDIIEQFKVDEKKIKVIYEGVANLDKGSDSLFVAKLNQNDILKDYHISSPFLLYVGNAYPHKNLEFLINNFIEFNKKNIEFKLVMVGKEDYFYKKLKNKYKDNNIIFTGYVSDEKLIILYQRASVYVFPSLYEGFGLPPLEALYNSCPVLSSGVSSMPEILEDCALYFDPLDNSDFLNKLTLIIRDNNLRNKMILDGKKLVKKYNWWECSFSTYKQYLKVLN